MWYLVVIGSPSKFHRAVLEAFCVAFNPDYFTVPIVLEVSKNSMTTAPGANFNYMFIPRSKHLIGGFN